MERMSSSTTLVTSGTCKMAASWSRGKVFLCMGRSHFFLAQSQVPQVCLQLLPGLPMLAVPCRTARQDQRSPNQERALEQHQLVETPVVL